MTSQRGPLHIVVTCANRKRHAVPADLHLRTVLQRRPADRFASWTRRLETSTSRRCPAIDAYAGEHWKVVRELVDSRAGRNAQLWIASAGYGLIPADAPICAYGATFSAPAPDTVGATVAEVSDWWQRLGEWEGPAVGPRTFQQLVAADRSATVIAVLSEAYQRACAEDLLAAAGLLNGDTLSVVGPPAAHAPLANLLIPVTAVLRHTVGGSLQALNIRVANYLLEHGTGTTRVALRTAAKAAVPANPPAARAAGQRMTDVEVAAYIRSHAHTSATQLLRQLRATGRSCEQHRFADLHRDVCDVHR
ncbi:hypothetical protein OG792_02280 [Micromonospora sp. NBC_01699]|uniref:hypothetical protein n=1 Tax=Micromonospora sp. NBC_01699 TaxID=2975984 RepID=UPI002E2968C7|nr:hypothetical protein [Micromonospora sp. NBC_01699]